MRRVLATRIAAPRRQVQIITAIATPNNSGTQAPSSSFSRLALKKVRSTTTNGRINAAAVAARQFHNFQTTTKTHDPVGDHGGGDRDAVGGRQFARGAEQQHQQDHAEQQQPVDARQIDLAGMGLGGVANLEARQQAELHPPAAPANRPPVITA